MVSNRVAGGLLAAAMVLAAVPAWAQMSLPGKLEVTDTGSASYTIPISVVPGTAGLEPKLSLQYDSRSGNGLLGVGWSLAGLPTITRCGRTIAQDGAVGGVAYDANDRFCLDGQRLIAINGGTYGADQTEYRTERESFSKVVSYGSAGSGPAWFKVWTKAGLVMEFGNTADSRIEAQGKASARVWAINKTSDTKGNYFAVSYTEDNANGEYRPSRIDYTGNGATAPINSVRFVYETRPDILPLYQAGSLIRATQRMTKVQAWQGETLIRDYRLSYEAPTAERLRSQISTVALCDGFSVCLPATTMTWRTGSDGSFTQVFNQPMDAPPFWRAGAVATLPIDYDGDGKTDILQIINSVYAAQLLRSNGDGTFTRVFNQQENAPPFWRAGAVATLPIDYDGDGKTDILQITNDAYAAQLLRSNGDGTFSQIFSQDINNTTDKPFWRAGVAATYPIDYDGDGKTDILQVSHSTYEAQLIRSNGDGTFARVFYQNINNTTDKPFWRTGAAATYLIDYDGDGKTDILQISGSTYEAQLIRSNGDRTFARVFYQAINNATDKPFWRVGAAATMTIDYDGDGKLDILQIANEIYEAQVIRSNGDGTFARTFYQAINNATDKPFWRAGVATTYPIDFDGDGKTDILQVGNDVYAAQIVRSNGDGTFMRVFNQPENALPFWRAGTGTEAYPIDYDGDGRTDILQIISAAYAAQVVKPQGQVGDLLKTFASTTATELSYATLPQGAPLHAKDTGISACAYPCRDVQAPMYVISEVKSSNGLGGEYRSTYRYAGAKSDMHGRGFLGFRQMTVRDEQTGVEQVTSYRQDYPFTGLAVSREKKLATQLLNRSTNSYSSTDLGGTRRYPFLTQSLEESWELSGAALPAVTTSYQYDAFGNATQVGVSTGDGHSKTTVNTYSNDTATWLLGRLTRSEVTSTTPGN